MGNRGREEAGEKILPGERSETDDRSDSLACSRSIALAARTSTSLHNFEQVVTWTSNLGTPVPDTQDAMAFIVVHDRTYPLFPNERHALIILSSMILQRRA